MLKVKKKAKKLEAIKVSKSVYPKDTSLTFNEWQKAIREELNKAKGLGN